MSGAIGWKAVFIGGLVAVFGYLTAANFVPKQQRIESAFWPDDVMRMGLDLSGGIHWVVGVDLKEATTRELNFLRKGIEERLAKDGIKLASSVVDGSVMKLTLAREEDRAKAADEVDERGVLVALREQTEQVMIERIRSDFVANGLVSQKPDYRGALFGRYVSMYDRLPMPA